ncbi:hypothetical protein QO179_23930 [Bacillus stercoris]|nr:hypothetical protein [Bacillus stercoris]
MTILKPVKVFTHTDLDGVGSGLIFQTLYNKDNVSVTYCDYKDINDIVKKFLKTDLSKWSKIFITDISVNEEVAELIQNIYQESFNHFVLLDHHGTATWLNKYEWALVQETFDRDGNTHKTSGTSLIIDWFRKQKNM